MRKATILVIEDEEKQRRVMGLHLAGADYEVKAAGTAEEGWKLAGDADLILTDLKLPGMDGLALLEKLKAQNSDTPVIVMSAFSTVENAVEAMKRGAVDFLTKPVNIERLEVLMQRALKTKTLEVEVQNLHERLDEPKRVRERTAEHQDQRELALRTGVIGRACQGLSAARRGLVEAARREAAPGGGDQDVGIWRRHRGDHSPRIRTDESGRAGVPARVQDQAWRTTIPPVSRSGSPSRRTARP